jgi:enoyl-CoA hydratase
MPIQKEMRGRVAVLRLAHGKANAFDVEFAKAIVAALDEVEDKPALEVAGAVITGPEGGRIFSAGVDLLRVLEGGRDYVAEFLPALRLALERLFFARKPLVAAVNGHAIAGGCLLAAACDRRLMARGDARIGVPERLVGVPFPAIALEILRFTVPPGALQEVAYLGRTYTPADAALRGLIDDVVEPDVLLQRACEAAESLGAAPVPAFLSTKDQLRQPTRDFLDAHALAIDEAVEEAWASEAARDAIRAYVEKTLKKR